MVASVLAGKDITNDMRYNLLTTAGALAKAPMLHHICPHTETPTPPQSCKRAGKSMPRTWPRLL
eukprot:1601880-Pleurochrysis_carterae.AAC.4